MGFIYLINGILKGSVERILNGTLILVITRLGDFETE